MWLARFRSTTRDGLVSLDEYIAAMRPGQEAIYTITGDNLDLLKKSPQLEGFRARGVEVLLLTDPIDEFWVASVGTYKEKPFKSATRGGVDLDKIAAPEDKKEAAEKPEPPPKLASLIAIFKLALGDAVKDVRSSERLTDSAVCLVADEGDIDMHLERLLKQHRQLDTAAKRILELNPRHRLIERLAASVGETGASEHLSEFAWLLLDQARIVEGEQLPDPPPSRAASRCCWNAACRRRHDAIRAVEVPNELSIATPIPAAKDRVSADGSAGCRRRSAECRRVAASPAARSIRDAR